MFKQRWAALFFLSGRARVGGRDVGQGGGQEQLCGRFAADICQAYLQTARDRRPDAGPARPARPVLDGPAAAADHRTDPDRARRAGHAVPPGPGRRQLPRAARHHRRRRWPGCRAATTAASTSSSCCRSCRPGSTATCSSDQSRTGAGDLQRRRARDLAGRPRRQDRDEPPAVTAADYPGRTGGSVEQADPVPGRATQQTCQPARWRTGGADQPARRPGGRRRGDRCGGYPLAVLPGQSAVFTTAGAGPTPQTLIGSGRVRLDAHLVGDQATLFVSLWDLGPDTAPVAPGPGRRPPGRGAAPGCPRRRCCRSWSSRPCTWSG